MDMRIKAMELEDTREISTWTYEGIYSFYSMDSCWETIKELIDGTYYSVFENSNIIGYFCYGESAQVPGGRNKGLYSKAETIDMGLGLRPDLTGKGIGLEFVLKGIEFGINIYKPRIVRLTVAEFNKRAIRVYERAGFQIETSFINKRNEEEREFIIMTKTI